MRSDIELQSMGFADVDPDAEFKESDIITTGDVGVEREIIDVLKEYVDYVVCRDDTQQIYVGSYDDDNNEMYKSLQALRSLDLAIDSSSVSPEDYEEFKQIFELYAECFYDELQKIGEPGAYFFLLTGKYSEEPFVSVVMIRGNARVLEPTADTLRYESFEGILPEKKEIDKAAVFPIMEADQLRLDGDMKLMDNPVNPAKYIERFFKLIFESASLQTSKNLLRNLDGLKEQITGREMSLEDIATAYRILNSADDGIADNHTIERASRQILGDEYSGRKVDEWLELNTSDYQIDVSSLPDDIELTTRTGIKIRIPFEKLDQETVEFNRREGRRDVINLEVDRFDKNYRGRPGG